MIDYTTNAYRKYVLALKSSFNLILRFDEYLSAEPKPDSFCLIRHDVDRFPKNALQMAKIEKEMGVRSTYYFRSKPHVFNPRLFYEIAISGHEIGYHYESLSDAKGQMPMALQDFQNNLNRFRQIVPVRTIANHGKPLSPYDNRDMWRSKTNKEFLHHTLGILGEAYLDIDYSEISYISDTGRNWSTSKCNLRDKVESSVAAEYVNGDEFLEDIKRRRFRRLIFQTHPERWNNSFHGYVGSLCMDIAVNIIKTALILKRK